MGGLCQLMAESKADVDQALAEAGVSWEGLGAEAMTAGLTPLAQWADDAGTAGVASTASVNTVGAAFAHASYSMPEPVQVTSTANSDFGGVPSSFVHMFGGQTDQDRQEQAAQEAKRRAVELMTGYETESGSAVGNVGTFVPPQPVTVAAAQPTITPPAVDSADSRFVGPTGRDSEPGGWPGTAGLSARVPGAGTDLVTPGGATATAGAAPVPVPGAGGPFVPVPGSGLPGSGLPGSGVVPGPGAPIGGLVPWSGRPGGRPGGLLGGPRGLGGPAIGEQIRGGRAGGGLPGAGVGEHGPGRGGSVGDDGHRGAGRGALPGAGEHAGGARGGAAGRAGGTAGPMGAGGGAPREEDGEHFSPGYLLDHHNEFWDVFPPVAPPVIGED
ncbi:PPE domain-containing protein [Actinokineospora sp.]|uniref:PPE domain-containing protein n=1 Tax=Actinokineospora sp. TaxID=1872133 RepID=UPI0040382F91